MMPELEVFPDDMADWATPKYSRRQVNESAELLIHTGRVDPREMDYALHVISNWRSSHSFPLNTFQIGLRTRSRRITGQALVAQRIKRLSSIALKLRRFPTMKLSQMQDIGGCRSVMSTVRQVRRLVSDYRTSNLKHRLIDIDDYIERPRSLSGIGSLEARINNLRAIPSL